MLSIVFRIALQLSSYLLYLPNSASFLDQHFKGAAALACLFFLLRIRARVHPNSELMSNWNEWWCSSSSSYSVQSLFHSQCTKRHGKRYPKYPIIRRRNDWTNEEKGVSNPTKWIQTQPPPQSLSCSYSLVFLSSAEEAPHVFPHFCHSHLSRNTEVSLFE